MLPFNVKSRWIRSIVEGSAEFVPLPWASLRWSRGMARRRRG